MKAVTANETTKSEIFTKLTRQIALDKRLKGTTVNLYTKMLGLAMTADFKTMTFDATVSELADTIDMSTRTIRRHTPKLIKFGYLVIRRHKSGKKLNMPSTYTMLNPFDTSTPQVASQTISTLDKSVKKSGHNCQANTIETTTRDSSTKETKETNTTWEAETPSVDVPSPTTQDNPSQASVNSEAPKVLETTQETHHEAWEVAVAEGKESIKPETGSSTPAPKKPENAPKELDLSNVPDILRTTAILLLTLSERTKLKDDEVKLLLKLLKKHYPKRIDREIEHQAQYFKEEGKNPHSLQMFLIYEVLKTQRSRPLPEDEISAAPVEVAAELPPDTDSRTAAIYEAVNPSAKKKRTRSNRKATTRTHRSDNVVQSDSVAQSEPVLLAMPVAEAEKVIATYEAEHAKPVEPAPAPAIPVALEELFSKMQDIELERGDEYSATLPKDEYGNPVWPKEDDGAWRLTLEDYLHLKYPEAEEEELCRDYSGHVYGSVSEHSEISKIKAAFEIDYACATCMNPEDCQLPEGCRKGQPKLEAKMFTSKDGKRFLGTGFEGCIKCRYNRLKPKEKTPEEKRQEAEFESMMHRSGITPMQRAKTFESLKPETPEIIVAKAMAILASKTGRNLVLAGRAGTGKTHLAIAIAIEAMRNGKQARMITACEMLDEITQAYRDNTDPLGVILKYKAVPVLVIDDWDKAKMSDARLDYLYQIINGRYIKGLQTIVTTNVYDMNGIVLPKWCKGSIEPIVSRLLENGDWVTIMEAENYRLKKPAPAAIQELEVEAEPVEVEPVSDEVMEAEVLAECEQIKAELASSEYKMLEETRAELDAELNARYCTTQQSEPEAPEPEEVVIPEADRSGKISLTEQPEAEQEPDFVPNLDAIPMMVSQFDVDDEDTELIAMGLSNEEIGAMSSEEWEEFCAKQKQKRECEERLRAMPKPPVKSWQEIAQSPEYQALSESNKLKRQWEYFRETPEYKNMLQGDKIAVQLDFGRRIREAELLEKEYEKPQPEAKAEGCPESEEPPKPAEPATCGIVIYVPRHNDGLDYVGDIRL